MYREILLLKNEYSKEYNNEFNARMKSVSDEIFQTEQIFPEYIPVGNYLKEQIDMSGIDLGDDQYITSPSHPEKIGSSWDVLSEYEKIIASHLLYGYYNAYIFSGGMGSGKTSTATQVLEFIKKKYTTPNSAFIKIGFDFNLGVIDEAPGVIERFKQELYIKLKVAIYTHIKNNKEDLVRKLWMYIEKRNFEDYVEYFDLGNVINNISWLEYPNLKKANEFIAYVEKNDDKVSRIEMFMKFFRFLTTDLRENEFIIIFYDNIDILQPFLQNKIFHDYILPLNSIAKTKCLISLRRTTFLRVFDFRDTRFAQSFGFIHHHGHKVSKIIMERLSYWKNNIDNNFFFNKVSVRYKEAFRKRIFFLHKEFSSSQYYSLKNYVDALAGNCVRLGLYISHRFLINNIIKFDESPSQRDRYKKALIVGLDSNTLLSDYEEIVNVFALNNLFSLLPIRILQLISSGKSKIGVKINDIVSELSNYCNKKSIIETVKILLFSRRPLLGIDRTDSSDDLDLEASLFITEIGYGYLNYLSEDLTYVQECFMAVKWDSDIVPKYVDVQNEYERLSTIIKCLRVAFDDDFDPLQKRSDKSCELTTPRIINRTIATIISLNYSAGFKQIIEDIEELLSYILNTKNVSSVELSELLKRIQILK